MKIVGKFRIGLLDHLEMLGAFHQDHTGTNSRFSMNRSADLLNYQQFCSTFKLLRKCNFFLKIQTIDMKN